MKDFPCSKRTELLSKEELEEIKEIFAPWSENIEIEDDVSSTGTIITHKFKFNKKFNISLHDFIKIQDRFEVGTTNMYVRTDSNYNVEFIIDEYLSTIEYNKERK